VASEIFQRAIRVDPHNVKALAFLASCYLNLIESSNKDESTFSVINKIIELSKDRQLDLLETVIAEVEFLAAQRRYDAGIQKLTEYSKVTGKFDPPIYYYLGWLFAQKGEYASAMKHLNMIPPNSFGVPILFYLRGFLFEESQDFVQAEAEYVRALAISKHHAKSILGRVRISEKKGELKTRAREIRFLLANPSYQNPKEYIQTLIYSSKLALLEKKPQAAVSALEDATRIDPRNETLKLEYFTLLSNLGSDPKFKMLAQMYSLLLEADRKQKAGNLHEAKATLLEAQDIFPKSTVPLEKIGDLFFRTGEFSRAHDNYKKALDLDKNNEQLAIKVIDSLIKNKETGEAEIMIAKYRTHPKLKSYVDRLAGDLAYDQGDYGNAATFYRKAMSRDTIDPEVYTAYANLMREADQCRDAQFFYSFAQRLDPFNYNAIMGTAKCILKSDGVESAVGRVQEELARLPKARADLLAGIAEIYFMAHDEAKALQFVQNAKEVDPEYPESYKIEGDIYYHQVSFKKEMKKFALEAWKSYSDRKNSDPYGYLKRFEVFLQDSNFEAADNELNSIFMISPRYPELHFRRAVMYRRMGRIKDGLQELELELKNNPRFDPAWVEQGESYLRDGAVNDALKSFSKAMSLNPKNSQAKIGAGYANYLKKQYASAIALLQAALSIDKGNPDIYKKLGMAYRDSGDQAHARQAFQNYLDLAPDAPDRAEYEAYKR
jgi:tetratricopeptide (TPR) repeat protein